MSTSEAAAHQTAGSVGSAAVAPGRRLLVLLGALLRSVLSSYLLMVLVAALTGLTAGVTPAPKALLVLAVPLWLAAHQVPLTVAGAPLGVLPLLPTVGVAALIGAVGSGAAVKLVGSVGSVGSPTTSPSGRWGGDAAGVIAALAGGHASLAVLATALPISPVQAQPWSALLGGGLVAAASATLGVLRAIGAPAWWPGGPRWLRAGLAAAGAGGAALAAGGALMLFAALVVSAGDVYGWYVQHPGLGVGVGMTALVVCYLPNAVAASVSWLAGPGLVIGAAAASPTSVSIGPLPPVPLMAAMPSKQPPGWSLVVFLLPVLAGVMVGLVCRRAARGLVSRLRAVAVAVVTIAAGFWVLASVVSGRLAEGPFDPVELPAVGGALALFGWLGVPAIVVALWPERTASRGSPASREPPTSHT
ncbi:MAG: hypothetical protein JO100_11450 [Pseudonocardia sp.]|nr:hypothetical protein [Pseudonocardia sp.]